MTLPDIALRWEGTQWVAYNIGRPTPWCAKFWSTGLGPILLEEAMVLFRSASVVILPAKKMATGRDGGQSRT